MQDVWWHDFIITGKNGRERERIRGRAREINVHIFHYNEMLIILLFAPDVEFYAVL